MPYRIRPSGTFFPSKGVVQRKLTDDSLVEYYTDSYSGSVLITLKEAKRRDWEARWIKIIGNTVAVIVTLIIIAVGYFLQYWIPINIFHAQPIVCFGCR